MLKCTVGTKHAISQSEAISVDTNKAKVGGLAVSNGVATLRARTQSLTPSNFRKSARILGSHEAWPVSTAH